MRVEERKEGNGWEGGRRNQFPVGMRVLAVDDDPTCLKVLEAFLLKCQYHVTTTNAAKTALKMLRENKEGFDLVISDVHMPDMDGFTLLELVGLEMDLPVIMLSGNGEREAVMKGIQHGACDYLLKPVRIEELKNIWQHVIRRRKFDSREHNNLDDGEDSIKPHHSNSEDEQGHNGRANRKRKDQEEDNCENKDSATQKKARVVWSVELHRKFVVAVTQLGFDRAVPKRILDLMKVEGLTRENVASHLQKFRLYLKRLNAVANQQENIAATFGVQDPSYLPLTSMDGFGDYHTLSASIPIHALPSFQGNRINPDIIGMHGLSPGVVQAGCIHNTTNNPNNELNELHRIGIPGNQHSHLLQGIPMQLEVDQSQQLQKTEEDKNHFQSSCSAGLTSGSSRKHIVEVTNNSLLPQARLSSVTMPSMATGAFGMGTRVSPQLPDIGRFNETWQSAVPSTGCAANIFPVGAPFSPDDLALHNIRSSVTMTNSQMHNNPVNVMPSTSIVAPPNYPMTGLDVKCQGSLFNGNVMLMQRGTNEDSNYLSFKRVGDALRNWGEPWKDHTSEPIIMFNPCGNPPFPGQSIVDPTVQSQRLIKRIGMNVTGQLNLSTPNPTYNCKLDKSITDAQLKYKGRYILDNPKLPSGLNSNSRSLDDLVNAMIKQE